MTPRVVPRLYWRIFLAIGFDIVFSFHLYYVYFFVSSAEPHSWAVGEWLINYQGGFIRRGLMGEAGFWLSRVLHVNLVVLLFVFQIIVYLFFLLKTYNLSLRVPFSALSAALIFSPAFILFPVLDWDGALKKEILLFLLLSSVCCHLIFSAEISKKLPLYIGICAVVVVLSHEMLAAYLPYVVCALIIREGGLGAKTKETILYMLPTMVAVGFLVTLGRGDEKTVRLICESLNVYVTPDCIYPDVGMGSITFLGKDLQFAYNYVLASIGETTILTYTLTGILGFLPLVFVYFSKPFTAIRSNHNMGFWLGICILSAVLGSIPLFLVVADYGRIIYIHVSCLSLLALMVLASENRNTGSLRLDTAQIVAWVVFFIYIGGWRLIHWKASLETGFPFINLF